MDPTQWGAPYPVVVGFLYVVVLCRASATYWLGRAIVAGARRTRYAHLVTSPRYLRAAERVDRWGPPAVALSFLTIGIQTLINLAAGATRMRLRHYLPAIAVGGLAWAFIYATIGFVGFEAFARLWERSPVLSVVLAVALVGGLAWFVASRVLGRRREAATAATPAA